MEPDTVRRFRVAVFVERGRRVWLFRAYTRVYNPDWDGCNMVEVEASSGTKAKALAIARIKARMDLDSMLAPSDVNVCED